MDRTTRSGKTLGDQAVWGRVGYAGDAFAPNAGATELATSTTATTASVHANLRRLGLLFDRTICFAFGSSSRDA